MDKPKVVGDPLEIRLRELATKATNQQKEVIQVDETTDEEKQDVNLWYNQYPELFDSDYLRTLPRSDLNFTMGIQPLDLRQHVAHHCENKKEKSNKEGKSKKEKSKKESSKKESNSSSSSMLNLATHVGFKECSEMDETSLLLLLKKSRNSLSSFTLHTSPIVTPETLNYLMASFRQLTTFQLINSNINDMHLQTVYSRPRYLKDGINNAVAIEILSLKGNGGITDEGISAMLKADACRWLQSLDLSECPNISDMALLNFKDYRMFQQLKKLNVSKINIGSLGVRQLSIACQSLTSLNLSGTF